jgi:pimeloyl-ACP methyl ester carboxylesterase
MNPSPYAVRRTARSRFFDVRGLRTHVLQWGDEALATPGRAPLLMLHGWMDVAASFQFVVDALPADRLVFALDWRGFGLSQRSGSDAYWFPDYLGDLDAVLDLLMPGQPLDLLGHSMGANVAMIYAGVRPERIRRLVNLEGFGMPESHPRQAPKRYAKWLDELKETAQLRSYGSLEAVAERLRKTNPLLSETRAAWLAGHWSRRREDGQYEILGDPAHKRTNPALYQKAEVLECWKQITAPVMWVEGDRTDITKWWGERYPRADFDARLAVLPGVEKHVLSPAGHMLHHDQPEQLAVLIEQFLSR